MRSIEQRGKIERRKHAGSPALSVVSESGGAFHEAMTLAETLFKGGGSFVPKRFKSAGEVLAAILTGQELGIGPMASLRSIHVVEGKPGFDYSLMVALLKQHGYRLVWHEQSAKKADLELIDPKGHSWRKEYTQQDAVTAGLWDKKDNWKNHPKTMLAARVIGLMARSFAAEVFLGSVFSLDELDEIEEKATIEATVKEPESETPSLPEIADSFVDDLTTVGSVPEMIDFVDSYRDHLLSMSDWEKRNLFNSEVFKTALTRSSMKAKDFAVLVHTKEQEPEESLEETA